MDTNVKTLIEERIKALGDELTFLAMEQEMFMNNGDWASAQERRAKYSETVTEISNLRGIQTAIINTEVEVLVRKKAYYTHLIAQGSTPELELALESIRFGIEQLRLKLIS